MPDNNFECLGCLRFFSPVEVNGAQFSVGVYYNEENTPCVIAQDLLHALGCHKSTIDKKTYEVIDKLNLELEKDYIVKHSEDVILNKVEHILGFEAVRKTVQLFKNDAAIQFFEAVGGFKPIEQIESDVLKLFLYDLVIRTPVFPLDVLSYALREGGWNDGEIDTESLIKMLKRDRILTRALRPVKGFEHLFVRFNNSLWVSPHGMSYLTRKYMGLSVHDSIGCVASMMPNASRLCSDSILKEDRVINGIETITESQESEVESHEN